MLPQNQIIVAVKSILLYKNRVLILKRSLATKYGSGIWEYPGGKIKFGETLQDALQREILEETGIHAAIGRLLYAVTLPTSSTRQIVILNYLSTAATGEVHLSGEHTSFLWATQAEMKNLLDPSIVENLVTFDIFAQLEITP